MRTTVSILAAPALVAMFSLPVAAQAPDSPARQEPILSPSSQAPSGDAQKIESARGELRSVDSVKKTLTIRNEAGTELVFQYNDDTKVTGAQNGVAGLATMSGQQLTVQYTMKGTDRIASTIEVSAAYGR